MRLIRLATNNNAQFDCNFDTPIEIKPNSKMALQNITLERGFDILEINDSNSEVKSFMNGYPIVDIEDFVPNGLINTSTTQDTFLHTLTQSLNGTLLDLTTEESRPSHNHKIDTNDFFLYGGSEFKVRRRKYGGNNIEILYVFSPSVSPFELIGAQRSSVFFPAEFITEENNPGLGANVGDTFHVATGSTKVTDREYLVELRDGVSMCRGSGCFSIQIQDSNDNGLGGGVLATNNGVGIGVCLGVDSVPLNNPDQNRLIDADVDFELYFNRNGSNYSMINGKGNARQDTGISPLKVRLAGHPNVGTHDFMTIMVEGNNIVGMVTQDNATDTQIAFETELTEAQREAIAKFGIQAYIYFNDDNTGIKVTNARFNPSPYVEFGAFAEVDEINFFSRFDRSIFGITDDLYKGLPPRYHHSRNRNASRNGRFNNENPFNFEIDKTIQKYLGYSTKQLFTFSDTFNVRSGMFKLVADGEISFTFSDFFMVESQTLQLDSYNGVPDSRLGAGVDPEQELRTPLKGDRKSILATIPINESLGNVEFETNTPIFIDIRNTGLTNIRNLKFRVVDKNFQPIVTTATTNMTILLED